MLLSSGLFALTLLLGAISGEPTNLARLHSNQFDSTAAASNSPLGLEKAQPCPRGKYRGAGLHELECLACPRGRYGLTQGLTTNQCSAKCPTGRYNDQIGAISEDDCLFCPPGKFGASEGAKNRECSGNCPAGRYSSEFGLVLVSQCVQCPEGYRGWQCEWDHQARKGTFSSEDGKINEAAHTYLNANDGATGQLEGDTDHPDGEWSADRYRENTQPWSGAWYRGGVHGAYPDNNYNYHGRQPDWNPADPNFAPVP